MTSIANDQYLSHETVNWTKVIESKTIIKEFILPYILVTILSLNVFNDMLMF